jgi:hypothetical protein
MLIITLLISLLFGQTEIDPSTFYCKTNYELKILKLSNNDLIFYGSEGGILRTTDAGNTWTQKFSGTHDNILKLIEHNNIVFGVTQTGEFMISEDKGDYWKYQKLADIATDFTILNEIIYVSSNTDTIFISSDYGITWESKTQNHTTNIKGISNVNDKLILFGNNQANKLFILNQDLTLDMEKSTPFTIGVFIDKHKDIYIKDGTKVAKLKSDLTWETYNLFKDITDFKFYPEENNISIFVYNKDVIYEPKIDYYRFDINKNSIVFTNSYSNNLFDIKSTYPTEFKTVEIEKINDEYILSNHHKTILKFDNENKWELICSASSNPNNSFISSYDKIVYGTGYGIVSTRDYGTTYQFKPLPIIDSFGDSIRISLENIEYIDDENALIFLSKVGLKKDNLGRTNPYRIAFTKDDFNRIEIIENLFSAPFLTPIQITECLGKINETPIINRTYKMVTTVRDSNNFLNDSLYFNCLYKINFETESIDSLYTIIDSLQFPKLYVENNKIWIYGSNSISNKNAIIYLSEDNWLTFNRVGDINLSTDSVNYPNSTSAPVIRRSKDGNLYLLSELLIAKINEDNYSYEKIPNKNFILFAGKANSHSGYLEDYIYFIIDQKEQKNRLLYSKLQIEDNNFKINNVFERKDFYLEHSVNNDNFLLIKSLQPYYNLLYFPIEPERLEYYASSVERGGPPAIWTYPPYPNPVKDRLKMKFYSAMMGEIAKLKVELIHIGSGRTYHIEKYDLNILDDYWGEIEIDVSGYIRGAYLINFKLGDGNKSESIIIE